MPLTSNIEELIKKFQTLAEESKGIDFSGALTAGVNAAMAQMKFRVFNTGKDATGLAFGKYIGKKKQVTERALKASKRLKKNAAPGASYTPYEKIRLSQGRQVNYKDLELTGTLRRGIVVAVESPTKVVCIIPNETNQKVAEGQQKQISRILNKEVNIWGMSDDERQLLTENTNQILIQIYARFFNS